MHALPTKVCNPPSASDSPYGFWVNPCGYDFKPIGEPPKEMNVTAVNVAIRSATTALFRARYLKDQFRNQTIAKIGTDPEITYSSIPTYEWLPQLPKISSEEELKLHLSSLDWQENILTIYKYLQNISVPLEQLVIDINQDQKPCPCEELCNNFNIMEGLMRNVLCELYDAMADNNLKVTENVTRDIMPDLLRGARKSKTDRNVRDWIVLRELEKILEYTLAACDYLVSQSA